MGWDVSVVTGLRCRPVSIRLGAGPSLPEALRRLSGTPGLIGLTGAWADGNGLVTARPLTTAPADVEPADLVGAQPAITAGAALIGGGWFGLLAYDGPSRLAFHDQLLRLDADGVWWFEALLSAERAAEIDACRIEYEDALGRPQSPTWTVGRFSGADRAPHLAAVENAVELIRAGEIYQVNVCTRLSAPFTGSPAALFADAVTTLAPTFGALVTDGDRTLAAFSPELFLRRRGRTVTTAPIKGTWPAGDPTGPAALRGSTKDAAENVMIVDLMRNDLNLVSEVGSVRASRLLAIERHPGVWHLVSTVTGHLRSDVDDGDLLRATFPPGSVTGTPKLRAISAIADLERVPRGAYTGAVGYASPLLGADWAVTIRSFEIGPTRLDLGVGGGVTADSVPMLEWRECLHKAAPLIAAVGGRPPVPRTEPALTGGLLETIACRNGTPLRLADHLARLARSGRELFRRDLPGDVADRVRAAAPPGRGVVRVRWADDGRVAVSGAPAGPRPGPSELRTVAGRTGLWRHKWADRSWADDAERAGLPLFVAADGTVLETSRGNVFRLLPDGTLVTPPLRDDLLPGVTRRAVLDLARDAGRPVRLREFRIGELLDGPAFWTSSLSGAVPIAAVDGTPLPRADAAVAAFTDRLGLG